MSYVRLKHTLAEIALDAIEHPDQARTTDLLLAYARRSRQHPGVPLATLARATGLPPAGAARVLLGTGLFDGTDRADRIALSAPFRPFASYLGRQAARTVAALRFLASSRRLGLPEEIWRAAALFNAGLFFECHEYLEDVWRAAPDPERAFYHGLVQAAAGCYHLEKGNAHGAGTLLGKAIAKLEPYAPAHRAVDVAALLVGLRGVVSRLDGASSSAVPDSVPVPSLPLVKSERARRGRGRSAAAPAPPGRAYGVSQNVRSGGDGPPRQGKARREAHRLPGIR